jgi:hypothetical protein
VGSLVRKKKLLGWLAAASAAAVAASLLAPAPDSPPMTGGEARSAPPAPTGPLAALPARETIGSLRGDLFSSRDWAPPKPAPAVLSAPPATPAPPPMPYRVAGHLVYGGGAQVVLAKGDAVLTVREGESLDGGYRVESIARDAVTLVYLPLGVREILPVASTLGFDAPPAQTAVPSIPEPAAQQPVSFAQRPAQLRWEGPQQVRAGDTFNVALKVTSAQPVRASPLELSFDAKLLEPVGVRAGSFFAEGNFSYRMSRNGSIFVGASGTERAADDAELLIVTFKSIRAGATAELKVSSLVLQSAAGRAIAHDQPVAFRTAIIQ